MPPAAEQSEEETYSDHENALRTRDESAWFKRHPYGTFRKDTKPWDEWCPRWLGQQKLSFLRQWHHTSSNLLHELQDQPNTYVDRHPDMGPDSAADRPDRSYWPQQYKVWTTHGWQLVLTATATEPIWDLCERHHQLREQAASLSHTESRGIKRTSEISMDVDSYQNVVTTVLQQLLTQQQNGTIQLQNLPPSDQAHLIRTTIHQVTALPRRPEGLYNDTLSPLLATPSSYPSQAAPPTYFDNSLLMTPAATSSSPTTTPMHPQLAPNAFVTTSTEMALLEADDRDL